MSTPVDAVVGGDDRPPLSSSRASSSSSLGSEDPLDRDWLSESLGKMAAARQRDVGGSGSDVDAGLNVHQLGQPKNDEMPLTVVTWNIWFSHHEWRARLEQAIWQTLEHNPDVFCFQEVTVDAHNCMLACRYLSERYEPTEPHRLPHGYDVSAWVRKGGPDRSYMWQCGTVALGSVFGRRGLCVDLEITTDTETRRARIATVHLESCREFAKMRARQLDELFAHIRGVPWRASNGDSDGSNGRIDASILLGDFNMHPTDPENALVEANGVDMWAALKPRDDGFTEDTDKNEMRLKHHGKRKQARYDRIVLVSSSHGPGMASRSVGARPIGIDILGADPFDAKRELWVSDHFGLVARVGMRDASVDVGPGQVKQAKASDSNELKMDTPTHER